MYDSLHQPVVPQHYGIIGLIRPAPLHLIALFLQMNVKRSAPSMIEVNDMNKKFIITVCSVLVLTLLVVGGVLLYFVQKLPIEIPVQEYIKCFSEPIG